MAISPQRNRHNRQRQAVQANQRVTEHPERRAHRHRPVGHNPVPGNNPPDMQRTDYPYAPQR